MTPLLQAVTECSERPMKERTQSSQFRRGRKTYKNFRGVLSRKFYINRRQRVHMPLSKRAVHSSSPLSHFLTQLAIVSFMKRI